MHHTASRLTMRAIILEIIAPATLFELGAFALFVLMIVVYSALGCGA